MAPRKDSLKPDLEMMGLAAGIGAGTGAGTTLTLSGIRHFRLRRFIGGLGLILASLFLALGFALEEELRKEEEAAQLD